MLLMRTVLTLSCCSCCQAHTNHESLGEDVAEETQHWLPPREEPTASHFDKPTKGWYADTSFDSMFPDSRDETPPAEL
jgi:hypothetical protein